MRLFLAALILMLATIPAGAQWLDRKTPGIPRTADGKPNLTAPAPRGPDGKPDLTGVWNGPNVVARPDPANLQPWVMRPRPPASAGVLQGASLLPVSAERARGGEIRRLEAHPPDADRHRDPERRPHLSRDPHGRSPAGGRPRSELDGVLGRTLGGRHAGRREQRIQRQDVGRAAMGSRIRRRCVSPNATGAPTSATCRSR